MTARKQPPPPPAGLVIADGILDFAKSPFASHAIRLDDGRRDVYFSGWTGDGDSIGHLDGKRVRLIVEEIEP